MSGGAALAAAAEDRADVSDVQSVWIEERGVTAEGYEYRLPRLGGVNLMSGPRPGIAYLRTDRPLLRSEAPRSWLPPRFHIAPALEKLQPTGAAVPSSLPSASVGSAKASSHKRRAAAAPVPLFSSAQAELGSEAVASALPMPLPPSMAPWLHPEHAGHLGPPRAGERPLDDFGVPIDSSDHDADLAILGSRGSGTAAWTPMTPWGHEGVHLAVTSASTTPANVPASGNRAQSGHHHHYPPSGTPAPTPSQARTMSLAKPPSAAPAGVAGAGRTPLMGGTPLMMGLGMSMGIGTPAGVSRGLALTDSAAFAAAASIGSAFDAPSPALPPLSALFSSQPLRANQTPLQPTPQQS
jgi:hypothetical protein